ncbi:MAG: hypothetical protein HKO06_06685 [Pseudomonadales bacterium]|nr:hypothetical protein [Pseudomonadales bacterium]
MNLIIDIETIPAQPADKWIDEIESQLKHPASISKPETIEAWHNGEGKYAGVKRAKAEEQYRKQALDGTYGEIITIGWSTPDREINYTHQRQTETEKEFLSTFIEQVRVNIIAHKYARKFMTDHHLYFIGHNVEFDLRFLWQRLIINDLYSQVPFLIPYNGRHGADYFCTMKAWAGYRDRISLDNLARAMGLGGKDGTSGSEVYGLWCDKEYEKIAAYCANDVDLTRTIFNRITIK